MKRYLVFCLTFFLLCFSTSASHIMGGEITWKCLKSGIDAGKYIFQMKIYRDCYGLPIIQAAQTIDHHNYPVLGQTTPIVMNFISVTDISTTGVAASGNTCVTCVNGDFGAVEEYTFESTPIFLAGSPPAQGWHFTWGTCCRAGVISNINQLGAEAITLRSVMYPYTDATSGIIFPTDSCYDNSPEFRELAKTMICIGSPFTYSDNASDQELDEISYSWGSPLGDSFSYDPSNPIATALPFLAPYSVTSPIAGNPTLDSQTGEIAFFSNTTGVFVICVKAEARKCGQIVAEIYRESQVVLSACPLGTNGMLNNSPTMSAPLGAQIWNNTINSAGIPSYSATVTAGELVNFNIIAEDLDMYNSITPQELRMTISGEPLSSNYIDSLLCDKPPCATFTELGGSPAPIIAPSLVSGVFEWQTSTSHINTAGCNNQSSVFVFSIKAYDDFCPVNGTNLASIKITIVPLTTEVEDQLLYLAIYPNPVNDILYVDGNYDAIQIFDILGKSLLKSEKKSEINISHLHVGTYIVELKIANKAVYKKLQVSR